MIQNIKGTVDLLPIDMQIYEEVTSLFKEFLLVYGYKLIQTPIIELAQVYKKENDTSDMVTKQMYSFSPNDKDVYTLRPEGTAGVVRSFIQNKLYATSDLPIKLGYYGPMFRHERPQKGRQRQFNQMGVECFSSPDPLIDSEVIALAYNYLKEIGLKQIKVCINTLGDNNSRAQYINDLIAYFTPFKDELCQDCKQRLNTNPLRILDCKIDHESDIVKKAPKMKLSKESLAYYNEVKHYLELLDIPYIEDDKLVRGLDYYTDTVFEIVSTDPDSGAQATILGGGRYNDLVKQMGGPDISGIGFAIGLERLIILAKNEGLLDDIDSSNDFYVINLSDSRDYAYKITDILRKAGLEGEMNYSPKSLKAQFKKADKLGSRFIIIVGEDEQKGNYVSLKDSLTKASEKVDLVDLEKRLNQLMEDYYV